MSFGNMRKNLIQIHLIIGSFFLPMGILFAVTGGLYTFGIKGDYQTKSETITVTEASKNDLDSLMALANDLLQKNDLAAPTGAASVKKVGTSWQFEWTGSRLDLLIDPTENPLELKASMKVTTPHRFLVQLHKAKGGLPFKLLVGAFAFGLVLLFVSGFFMAQASPPMRRTWFLSAALGVLTFGLLAFLS